MNKLYIFKGDDTGGTFGRTLVFKIDVGEGISLDGCRADFTFDGITKTFPAPLVAGESREIFYSHNETAGMALGTRFASFRIIDAAGKIRTFDNTIKVCVTDDVSMVYPGSTDTATITIGAGISWDLITGKPALVKSVNGNLPDASGNVEIEAGGGKATTLHLDATGKKVFNGDVEITTYKALYNIVIGGNCVILGTVAASMKDAFYYPHLCDQTAIRFDATGTLDTAVDTRSVAITPKTGGGYNVSLGSLTELATKIELDNKTALMMERLNTETFSSRNFMLYCSHREGAQNNQAIITGLSLAQPFAPKMLGGISRMRLRGASTDSGTWDKRVKIVIAIGTNNYKSPLVDIPIGGYVDIPLQGIYFGYQGSETLNIYFEREDGSDAKVRLGLVSNANSQWIITGGTGQPIRGFDPLIEFYGNIERTASIDAMQPVLANLAAVNSLPANATAAQVLAKVNELINYMKEGSIVR